MGFQFLSLYPPRHTKVFSRALVTVTFLLGCWIFILDHARDKMSKNIGALLDSSDRNAGDPLEIVVHDDYTKRDGASDWDYPWLSPVSSLLVHPHMDSSLVIENVEDTSEYHWHFENTTRIGYTLKLYLTEVGDYRVDVAEVDRTTGVTHGFHTFTLYCRYVRRELRLLTAKDREIFFGTAKVLWDVGTKVGQQRFGMAYRGAEYFTELHNSLAGARDCDHIHDGLGFLTNHIALSLRFEQSLQSVNPYVSLPYWDVTIDHHRIETSENGNFEKALFESELWQPDWFGSTDPNLHYVTEGRWAYTQVNRDAWNTTHNPYGFMRAPWNSNPIEFVTRSHTECGQSAYSFQGWPGCDSHLEMVVNFTDLSSFTYALQVAPHGPVHVNIGGTFGCEEDFDRLSSVLTAAQLSEVKVFSFAIPKNMYRLGLRECPQYCSTDSKPSECRCGCPAYESFLSNISLLQDSLFNTKVIPSSHIATALKYISSRDKDGIQKAYTVADVLCHSQIHVGDQLESASPGDISFWPIHPAIERLWMWKKLNKFFDSEHWPNSSTSIYGSTCTGHGANDMVGFPISLWDTSIASPERLMTNIEMYNLADPESSSLPYVYDSFTWPHCTEEGYDFRKWWKRNAHS